MNSGPEMALGTFLRVYESEPGQRGVIDMWWDSKTERAYVRELPGGGFVAIDVHAVHSLFHGRRYVGTLAVERRTGWRRAGHTPPIIAEASGPSVESVVEQLLPIAQSNPAIGAAILRRVPIEV